MWSRYTVPRGIPRRAGYHAIQDIGPSMQTGTCGYRTVCDTAPLSLRVVRHVICRVGGHAGCDTVAHGPPARDIARSWKSEVWTGRLVHAGDTDAYSVVWTNKVPPHAARIRGSMASQLAYSTVCIREVSPCARPPHSALFAPRRASYVALLRHAACRAPRGMLCATSRRHCNVAHSTPTDCRAADDGSVGVLGRRQRHGALRSDLLRRRAPTPAAAALVALALVARARPRRRRRPPHAAWRVGGCAASRVAWRPLHAAWHGVRFTPRCMAVVARRVACGQPTRCMRRGTGKLLVLDDHTGIIFALTRRRVQAPIRAA